MDETYLERAIRQHPNNTILGCSHLKSGEARSEERVIDLGNHTVLLMCKYCSGAMVETVLQEYVKKPVCIRDDGKGGVEKWQKT